MNHHSLCNWISRLPNPDLLISELSIPGTHDSGSWRLAELPVVSSLACTQRDNIYKQLEKGVRFLDIRVKPEKGKLWVYHGGIDCALSLDEVFDLCREFLKQYPGEFILMSVKREGGVLADVVNLWQEQFGNDPLIYDLSRNSNGTIYRGNGTLLPTIRQVRGKIVLFRRFKADDIMSIGGIDITEIEDDTEGCVAGITDGPHPVAIMVQDRYLLAAEDSETKQRVVRAFFDAALTGTLPAATGPVASTAYMFLNFTSFMAGSEIDKVLEIPVEQIIPIPVTGADILNPWLKTQFKKRGRYGVVIMDFAVSEVTNAIIATNFPTAIYNNFGVTDVVYFTNKDMPGYSVLGISLEQGLLVTNESECEDLARNFLPFGCTGWLYSPSKKLCWLFKSIGNIVEKNDSIVGITESPPSNAFNKPPVPPILTWPADGTTDKIPTSFKLTEESFIGLERDGVLPEVCAKLKVLKHQEFIPEDEFLRQTWDLIFDQIKNLTGDDVQLRHRQLILKHARFCPIELSWKPNHAADTYTVQIFDAGENTVMGVSLASIDNLVANTYRPSPGLLMHNGKYAWRVSARNQAGESTWSETWTFTTARIEPPALLEPPSDRPFRLDSDKLSWTNTDKCWYSVQVSTIKDFSTPLVDVKTVWENEYFFQPNLLRNNIRYYWRVKSNNPAGSSLWSNIFSFITEPEKVTLSIPVPYWPANGKTHVGLQHKLLWATAAETTSFAVQISTLQDFSSPVVYEENILGTGFQPVGLKNSTSYYWRVKAMLKADQRAGESPWSDIFTFTTEPEYAAPTIPTLLSASAPNDLALSTTLNWSAAREASAYRLQVSLTNDFSSPSFEATVYDLTYTVRELRPKTTYFWRVRAMNVGKLGEWAPSMSFITGDAPPEANLKLWGGKPNYDAITTIPAGLTNVVKIAVGHEHTVALKADGKLVQWGHLFSEIPPLPGKVTDLAAGYQFTAFLLADGTVWINRGDKNFQIPETAGLTGVKAIAAGKSHVVALKTDSSIAAWTGDETSSRKITLTLPEPYTAKKSKAIAASEWKSIALLEDGTVVVWGKQDPKGIKILEENLLEVQPIPGGKVVVAGGYHVVVLKEDGTVVQWGDSTAGTVPTGLKDVIALAACSYHTLALKKDGTVRGWGRDDGGETMDAARQPPYGGAIAVAVGSYHAVVLIEQEQDRAARLDEEEKAAQAYADAEVVRKAEEAKTIAEQEAIRKAEEARILAEQKIPSFPVTPLAHWKLDGDGSDTSGNGLEATLLGGAIFTANSHNGLPAVTFNGAGAYVDLGILEVGNTFTLSAWFLLASPVQYSINTILASAEAGAATNGFKLFVNSWGTQDLRLIFETGNGSSGAMLQTEPNAVMAGKWNHVAVVVDRVQATATLYLNGAPVATTGSVQNDFATNRPVHLGRFVDGNFYLQGEMDDVRFYNALLSPTDVSAMPTEQPAQPSPILSSGIPPLASWLFNGDGNDASGNGHPATLLGGATFTANSHNGAPVVALNGNSAYVDAGLIDVGNTFTFSAWFFLSAPLKYSINTILSSAEAGAATNGFKLFVNSWGTQDLRLIFETGNGSSGAMLQTEPNAVTMGQWHHVAVVVDRPNATATLYLNGAPVAATGSVRNDFATHRPIHLGRFVDGYFHLQGEINDVRIYNRLLLPTEVGAISR